MIDKEIHSKSESFKSGWASGFYDALSDDGVRYIDEILRYGIRGYDEQAFLDGYRSGRQARRGPESGTAIPTMLAAAA
jgi:hypothetical protein